MDKESNITEYRSRRNKRRFQLLGVSLATVGLCIGSIPLFMKTTEIAEVSLSVIGVLIAIATAMAFASLRNQNTRAIAFISYSFKDKDIAKHIKNRLIDSGVIVFDADTDVLVGESIKERVEEMINQSDFVVGLLSTNTTDTEWSKLEYDILKVKKKDLFPVKLDDVEIPEELIGYKYADMTASPTEAVDQLLAAIKFKYKSEKSRSIS